MPGYTNCKNLMNYRVAKSAKLMRFSRFYSEKGFLDDSIKIDRNEALLTIGAVYEQFQ
jgi:hypothetical protein